MLHLAYMPRVAAGNTWITLKPAFYAGSRMNNCNSSVSPHDGVVSGYRDMVLKPLWRYRTWPDRYANIKNTIQRFAIKNLQAGGFEQGHRYKYADKIQNDTTSGNLSYNSGIDSQKS